MEKEAIIHVRVARSQYDKIKQKADELGLSVSAYIRMLTMIDVSK